MATYKQVSYGSKGSEVTELQKLLNNNGYSLDVDGNFGAKTQAAVKDYQKKNNLSVDGIVGTNTWGALTSKAAVQTPSEMPEKQTGANTTAENTKGFTYDDFSYGDFSYGDYTESDTVKQANALLQQQNAAKPGAYQSQWQSQIDSYLNQIQNRDPFSYDFNADALYNQYKDMYTQQGQMAMMDTMGQAAAMTGGYGNSYAQSAGQQAYQGYLQQLNNVIPELQQAAFERYAYEGDQLQNMYNMYLGREEQDYGRYMDGLNAWQTERDYLANRYDAERSYDYSKWETNRDFAYNQYNADRNLAYDQYSSDRDVAWNEYVANQEKEQAAAELMAGAGNYDRLGNMYGLSSDEISAIKAANTVKTSSSGTGTKTKNLSADEVKSLQDAYKRSDGVDAMQFASYYGTIYGVDPSLVYGALSIGGLLTDQPLVDPPAIDDPMEEEKAKRRSGGGGTGLGNMYPTIR